MFLLGLMHCQAADMVTQQNQGSQKASWLTWHDSVAVSEESEALCASAVPPPGWFFKVWGKITLHPLLMAGQKNFISKLSRWSCLTDVSYSLTQLLPQSIIQVQNHYSFDSLTSSGPGPLTQSLSTPHANFISVDSLPLSLILDLGHSW